MWVREFKFNVPVLWPKVLEHKKDAQFDFGHDMLPVTSQVNCSEFLVGYYPFAGLFYCTERSEAQTRKAYSNAELETCQQ